jgi:hypothetical protein
MMLNAGDRALMLAALAPVVGGVVGALCPVGELPTPPNVPISPPAMLMFDSHLVNNALPPPNTTARVTAVINILMGAAGMNAGRDNLLALLRSLRSVLPTIRLLFNVATLAAPEVYCDPRLTRPTARNTGILGDLSLGYVDLSTYEILSLLFCPHMVQPLPLPTAQFISSSKMSFARDLLLWDKTSLWTAINNMADACDYVYALRRLLVTFGFDEVALRAFEKRFKGPELNWILARYTNALVGLPIPAHVPAFNVIGGRELIQRSQGPRFRSNTFRYVHSSTLNVVDYGFGGLGAGLVPPLPAGVFLYVLSDNVLLPPLVPMIPGEPLEKAVERANYTAGRNNGYDMQLRTKIEWDIKVMNNVSRQTVFDDLFARCPKTVSMSLPRIWSITNPAAYYSADAPIKVPVVISRSPIGIAPINYRDEFVVLPGIMPLQLVPLLHDSYRVSDVLPLADIYVDAIPEKLTFKE